MSDDNMDIDDHLEASNGTGVLIPQAQIMEVLHHLNVSEMTRTYSINNADSDSLL